MKRDYWLILGIVSLGVYIWFTKSSISKSSTNFSGSKKGVSKTPNYGIQKMLINL
jgi:hypothetical protein